MTANLIKGKGFRGALRYNLGKVAKNVAEVLDSTFARSSEEGIMKEVQMIRSLRPRLEKYFYHTSINFPPDENISSDLMKRIGREYLNAADFTQHQFIMFRHFDAAHPHLHILVNRIGYDGTVLTDSQDFQRTENILRSLEIKYELRQVVPSRQARVRAVTKNEIEMMKRTGEPSQKLCLQRAVSQALKDRPDLDTFMHKLQQQGVLVIFNKASTGHVSGISYEMGGFKATGTKLGAGYKWPSVKARLSHQDAWKTIDAPGKSHYSAQYRPGQKPDASHSLTLHLEDDNIIIPKAISGVIEPELTTHSDNLKMERKKRRRKRR
jgi:hypothetical protein